MPSKRSFARWLSWEAWETNKLRKDLAEQQQGKWQRLPDGTWGYPPQEQAESAQAAFERGWRAGWEAGYAAAMREQPAED